MVDINFVVPMVFLAIGIILGNVLVLIAAWRNKVLRKQGRIHIVSLAITDLLTGLIGCPIQIYGIINLYYFPASLHIFYFWVNVLCSSASVTLLTVISVDRCYKIVHPFHYKTKVTSRRTISIVGVVWVYSATFATLGCLSHKSQNNFFSIRTGCITASCIWYLVAFSLGFVVPCVLLVTSYIVIFIVAYRRRRKWSKQNQTVSAGERLTFLKDLKNAKTLAIMVLVFMVFWGPQLSTVPFVKFSSELCDIFSNRVIFTLIMIILPYGNSICNPIIYALRDKEYRRTLKTTFRNICFK